MNRRIFLASVGTATLAGCADLTTSEREADAEPLDLGRDRGEVVGFFHDDRELGRFGMMLRALVNVPYEFSVAVASEDEVEWQRCMVEFAFPDASIRPPFIYLQGDTTVEVASFTRRSLSDEFTTLEIQESTDEFNLDFRGQPLESSERDVEEIPIELNFEGTLVDDGFRGTKYRAKTSISSTLVKELA